MKIDSMKVKMLQLDLTQAELARKAGVSRASLSNILSRGTCSLRSLSKLAKALGVEPAELVRKEA